MIFRPERYIQPELLDEQSPEDAEPSLRDLVRINRLLGGNAVLRRTMRRALPLTGPFTVLDVGSASGEAGAVIRTQYPQAIVTSLDYRLHHLRGAAQPRVVADAFRLPFAPRSFDVVHCSLFLHHFTDIQVTDLLREFGRIARRAVLVNDLERHWIPFYFLPLTRWVFGWNRITLHDGPISVQAGFRPAELRNLAEQAGLREVKTYTYRPAFRIGMVAQVL